jgi:hypothetical protein
MSNYVVTTIDTDFTPESHTVSNTSAQSSAIITQSGLVRISVTGGTHVKFGANPTATTEDVLVVGTEIFSFKSGDKIAFIHHGGGSAVISICAVD